MLSPMCERAIEDARHFGKAIMKFISANDVGKTGGHQCGYYLPKAAWRVFTKNPPDKGINSDEIVSVLWQDGRETQSRIVWYGKGTRSEYRMTRFGKDFPWLAGDSVGDLLVLVPVASTEFRAYVMDTEEDIDDIQASLGVEIVGTWTLYDSDAAPVEDPSECVDRFFREYVKTLTEFPTTIEFSQKTLDVLFHCIKEFGKVPNDDRLMKGLEEEYRMFRMAERLLCQNKINRVFRSVDDFLETAQGIIQRRKARAGRSFENHVAQLLKIENIPFSEQPVVDGRPDFIIPSKDAYLDESFPTEKLVVLAIKRTCKDRWRQVTREARRVKTKHLMTIQKGISSAQLEEMNQSDVRLIVPKSLHKMYPKDNRDGLVSIDQFINSVREIIG